MLSLDLFDNISFDKGLKPLATAKVFSFQTGLLSHFDILCRARRDIPVSSNRNDRKAYILLSAADTDVFSLRIHV